MRATLVLVLPLLASAEFMMKKPKPTEDPKVVQARLKEQEEQKKKRQSMWKNPTVAADWETSTQPSPSQPDEKGVIRPRFEIIPTAFEAVGGSNTVEIFWQRPKADKIKGIFFGATGCFHQGGDFFEPVDPADGWEFKDCAKSKLMRCQGLPDNVYTFKYALERDYLVMTTTPQDKNSCWNHELDPKRVDEAVKYVIHTEGLDKDIKMFATGASQGGQFMYDMQEKDVRNLKCIAPQLAGMKYHTGKEHLPTMMIWMPKDVNETNSIRGTIDYLKSKKVRVTERTPHAWKIQELMRARGFSEEIVTKTKNRFDHAKGPFGHRPVTRGGHIIDHPGTDDWWKIALRPVWSEEQDSFVKDHSKMHHVLQVAFAEHEFTAEYTDHIIDFCEGHEDKTAPLRFNRNPVLIYPSAAAIACSPNCPPPGSVEEGPLSNYGMYLADVNAGKTDHLMK